MLGASLMWLLFGMSCFLLGCRICICTYIENYIYSHIHLYVHAYIYVYIYIGKPSECLTLRIPRASQYIYIYIYTRATWEHLSRQLVLNGSYEALYWALSGVKTAVRPNSAQKLFFLLDELKTGKAQMLKVSRYLDPKASIGS